MENDRSENRGVTLNSLQDERRSLNMRLLLAIQTHDTAAQEALERELEENADRINRLLSGIRH